MLILLAERLSKILDWLQKIAGYRIVEMESRSLNMSCDPQDKAFRTDPLKSDSDMIRSAVVDCFPHLNEWIASSDKVSFMWLTSFASNSKEELHQALGGEEICLLGISYSDVQSLSCRSTPKQGNCTLPRCKSYRLRKNSPLDDSLTGPLESLSMLARRTGQCRVIYFSRVGYSLTLMFC